NVAAPLSTHHTSSTSVCACRLVSPWFADTTWTLTESVSVLSRIPPLALPLATTGAESLPFSYGAGISVAATWFSSTGFLCLSRERSIKTATWQRTSWAFEGRGYWPQVHRS